MNYARRERPRRASQMSQCLDAGTGCGWCIPFLKRIWEDPDRIDLEEMSPQDYASRRQTYIDDKKPRNEF